ncbi:hypothetical protein BHE74_00056476, partial [Ensete ventricosum]
TSSTLVFGVEVSLEISNLENPRFLVLAVVRIYEERSTGTWERATEKVRSVVAGGEPFSLTAGVREMIPVTSCKEGKMGIDQGKYVRYTPEQVEALERLYHDCPKPSSLRRQQLIRECPILSNIDPKQIKVWFQNRRCREKQRKEAAQLQAVNRKLTAMNKLLMEENDRLQKQVSQLVYENGYFRQQTQNVAEILKDRVSWFRECRSVDVINVMPTANNGIIELLYMQVTIAYVTP